MATAKPKPKPTLKPAVRPANEAAPISLFIATAARAFAQGNASEHQQKELLKWIVFQACGKAYTPYHASDRDTCFALGRAFVADQLNGLLQLDIDALRRASE